MNDETTDFVIPAEARRAVATFLHDHLCGCEAPDKREGHSYHYETLGEDALAAALPHLRARQIEVQTAIGHALGRAEGRKEALAEAEAAIDAKEIWFREMHQPHTADGCSAAAMLVRDLGKGEPA